MAECANYESYSSRKKIKLSQKGSLYVTRTTLAHYTATREEDDGEVTIKALA